jgi:hypothetical protein
MTSPVFDDPPTAWRRPQSFREELGLGERMAEMFREPDWRFPTRNPIRAPRSHVRLAGLVTGRKSNQDPPSTDTKQFIQNCQSPSRVDVLEDIDTAHCIPRVAGKGKSGCQPCNQRRPTRPHTWKFPVNPHYSPARQILRKADSTRPNVKDSPAPSRISLPYEARYRIISDPNIVVVEPQPVTERRE